MYRGCANMFFTGLYIYLSLWVSLLSADGGVVRSRDCRAFRQAMNGARVCKASDTLASVLYMAIHLLVTSLSTSFVSRHIPFCGNACIQTLHGMNAS